MGIAADNHLDAIRSYAQVAWAAGVFEGEGTIAIGKSGVRLVVCMTDRDVVERFAASAGCGTGPTRHRPPSLKSHHKTQWRWQCATEEEVVSLLIEWFPFFGERRAVRAREALEFLSDENKLERVCWCGKPFLTRRSEQYACCETHRRAWRHAMRYRYRMYPHLGGADG